MSSRSTTHSPSPEPHFRHEQATQVFSQSEAGSGLAAFNVIATPSQASSPTPEEVHSTSTLSATSTYLFPINVTGAPPPPPQSGAPPPPPPPPRAAGKKRRGPSASRHMRSPADLRREHAPRPHE